MKFQRQVFYLLLLLALTAMPVMAKDKRLGVGTYIGIHQPDLGDLNEGEFKSPLGGVATIVDIDPALDNAKANLNFANPLPSLGLGVNAGLEFQWLLNKQYMFIAGGGTWESTIRATTTGGFYVQGKSSEVFAERLAKVSYNEFYFGLRRSVVDIPKKYNIYYRLTLNEIFDIDYREDLVFNYLTGPAADVKKSVILQSQATGMLAIQPGFGMEYFLRDWFSVAMDASYIIGFRRVALRDGKSEQDFLTTDNLSLWLPQRVSGETGDLEYLDHNFQTQEDYNAIRLSFDGWKLLFRMNLYF